MIAQQKPRSLWAIQALVAGHGDERRVQFVHPPRQDPGGLGRVQHKGHARFGAQGGHLPHRLHAAEHIGHMIADHNVHAGRDQLVKGPDCCLLIEQRSACYGHLGF